MAVVKQRGRLFVISSPSGGGKSSLINNALKATPGLTLSTSHTSRPPRANEEEGVHYYFVSPKEFVAMKREGGFVESVRLHGHYYGTSRRELDRLMAAGLDILLDIDVRGAKNVLALYPEAVLIFILPPSLAVLEQRLRRRGSEDEGQIQTRLEAALREVRAAGRYRYCIVNDRLEKASAQLIAVITAERARLSPRALKKLLADITR